MGMPPEVVDRTSFWQFLAAWNGYVEANAPRDGKITEREAEDLFGWIDEGPASTEVPPMPELKWDGGALILVHTAA